METFILDIKNSEYGPQSLKTMRTCTEKYNGNKLETNPNNQSIKNETVS